MNRNRNQINWRPVSEYADKLREWDKLFGFGVDSHINDLELPDHAGPFLPTSVGLTFGKGLERDYEAVSQVLKYELGAKFQDYRSDYGISYFPGSEPIDDEVRLRPALLDIQRFWDPDNGFIPRDVREQFRGQLQPTFELDWLVALNAEMFAATYRVELRGLFAPGLVIGWEGISVFLFNENEVAAEGSRFEGGRWYDHIIVSFQNAAP